MVTRITKRPVKLAEYQKIAKQTDRNKREGLSGLRFPLLGLFGEVGTLLSELKKKQRDKESYYAYDKAVVEEFGDVLWYFSNIAGRAGFTLEELAGLALDDLAISGKTRVRRVLTFTDLQAKTPHLGPTSDGPFETEVLRLAAKAGSLLGDVDSYVKNRELLKGHLVEIFRSIIRSAEDASILIDDIVRANIDKITGRWPFEKVHTHLFDEHLEPDEQLPRRIEMLIEEQTIGGKTFVIQKCKGIKIGDRLTDNKTEQDDYRFHDVFHLGYAAVLGWSPVIRGQFRVKRKSILSVDENQDGARAALIEEGVATGVFNHALRLKFFEDITTLDFALLKAIRELVQGYEVADCPLWMWEKAILDGYNAFRFLRKHRKAIVIADLNNRKLIVRSAG
jgi:NTP pyrophosphatase (non-canonical NTP hydrolase)